MLQANWIIPNATVRQWLGRDLSNQAPNITVNLLEPGQMRGERVNQIDFRVGKLLRFGRQRATLSVDMFNLLNPDTILTYNQKRNPVHEGQGWTLQALPTFYDGRRPTSVGSDTSIDIFLTQA